MDLKYFGAMLIRELTQADIPISKIEPINEEFNLLNVIMEDNSCFQVTIGGVGLKLDSSFYKMENCERIGSIYRSFVQSQECNEIMTRIKFDIDWVRRKLSIEEYCKLENFILDYAFKNDETIFTMGFKYAWFLFYECLIKGDGVDYCCKIH